MPTHVGNEQEHYRYTASSSPRTRSSFGFGSGPYSILSMLKTNLTLNYRLLFPFVHTILYISFSITGCGGGNPPRGIMGLPLVTTSEIQIYNLVFWAGKGWSQRFQDSKHEEH